MIFLIEYSKNESKLVNFRTFADSDRKKAEEERLRIELSLKDEGLSHEVVLIEAIDEKTLRRTYQRYFRDLGKISESFVFS